MKIFNSTFKKIFLFGTVLILTVSTFSLTLVSCSNTSNPEITTSTTYVMTDSNGTFNITRTANELMIKPAVTFDGKDFEKVPAIPTSNEKAELSTQKAIAYFTLVNNFTIWLQAYVLQTQNFLSATPNNLKTIDAKFDNELINLAAALSTCINQGANTARLGVKSINVDLDIYNSINTNLLPYNKETIVDTVPETSFKENIQNISVDFGWWTTNKKNEVKWTNWNDETLLKQDLSFWSEWKKQGIEPKSTYTLEVGNVDFSWKNKYTKNADAKFYPNGSIEFVNVDAAFAFANSTGEKTGKMLAFLLEADKQRMGDLVGGSFLKYVTSEDQKENLNSFLVSLKK